MSKNPRIDKDWRDPLRRSEIATDFGISLSRIRWDYFATLTFAGTIPKTNIAYGLAFRWLQEISKVCGIPYKHLLVALRGEEGEKNGRFHFHCLIGGTNARNYHSLQHKLEWFWKVQSRGARVEVRQYDLSQAGAEYVCKCLGANQYELGKYSFANSVTLSASVIRLITGIDASGDRRCGLGHMERRVGSETFGEKSEQSKIYDETTSCSAGMVTVPA